MARNPTTLRVRNTATSSIVSAVVSGIGSAVWTDFTPQLFGSTTNPGLGTGTTTFQGRTLNTVGRYLQLGDVTLVDYQIVFGSGSTPGSGNYSIEFPTSEFTEFNQSSYFSIANSAWPILGEGIVYNSTGDKIYAVQCGVTASGVSTSFVLNSIDFSFVYPFEIIGSVIPFTFADGCFIKVELFYPTLGYGGIGL